MIRNVIIKVTLDCNISCKYCYVQRNRDRGHWHQTMSENTLTTLIRAVGNYLSSQLPPERFVLYWHGGEPLRAGSAFFKRCRALQTQYIPQDITVVNTIQTNGILLTDEWAQMIKDYDFGVCVSLDGPPDVHDAWRRTQDNRGTHDMVIRGIEVLQRHDIPFSILSVISPQALPHGARIYSTLRNLGCSWMDFMYPFYSLIDNTIDMNICPAKWGEFLVDVFDAWMAEADPNVTIRLLEDICMMLLGGRTQMCVSGVDCSYVITVNPNGDVFICDDLLAYTDSQLGNIHRDNLMTLSQHPLLRRLKEPDFLFGVDCQSCDLFTFCRGGCTLFRARRQNDFRGRHYFCKSQRRIISHIRHYFQTINAGGRPTTKVSNRFSVGGISADHCSKRE